MDKGKDKGTGKVVGVDAELVGGGVGVGGGEDVRGREIASLQEISEQYDLYIVDIYGVIFDGEQPIEEALDAIMQLIAAKKAVFFLSNSPRPNSFVRRRIQKRSNRAEHRELLDQVTIYTSGDFFIDCFVDRVAAADVVAAGGVVIGAAKVPRLYPLGGTAEHHAFAAIRYKLAQHDLPPLEVVDDPAAADQVVSLAFSSGLEEQDIFDEQLAAMRELNLPLICPNPDIIVADGENRAVLTPGFFADRYFALGGQVEYFGKPFSPIYDYALRRFRDENRSLAFEFDPAKTLCIGDSLIHDVAGGYNIGAATLLVGGSDGGVGSSGGLVGRTKDPRWLAAMENLAGGAADYFLEKLS